MSALAAFQFGAGVGDDPVVSDDVLDGTTCARCLVDFELGEVSVPGGWSDGCELWRHPACL
jgi:hypothetical protein